MRRLRLLRLVRDRAGAAAVEFAMATPILMVIVAGTLEMAQAFYVRTVLQGAINAAARNSSLESSQSGTSTIDNKVITSIQHVMPNAQVTTTRRNYAEFSDVGRPEDFTDTNRNGSWDTTECFTDMNGNNTWDADLGRSGLGGANDVVQYTVSVTYDHWFGFASALGLSATQTMSARTLLRNQPFATQSTRTGNLVCP